MRRSSDIKAYQKSEVTEVYNIMNINIWITQIL